MKKVKVKLVCPNCGSKMADIRTIEEGRTRRCLICGHRGKAEEFGPPARRDVS